MSIMETRDLLREIEGLYFDYADAIDQDVETWPDLFTENAVYKVIPRENYDRGLPLAAIYCAGRGMILDRAMPALSTTVHAIRYMRHAITNIRIVEETGDLVRASANFAVYETMETTISRLFAVGRYLDVIDRSTGMLKFKEKLCVMDSNIVIGSLIYPI